MSEFPFTVFDLAVIAVLAVSALLAFLRGFVHEVLAVVAWIGAIFAVFYGLPHVRPYAQDLIATPLIADIAAGALIFVAALVVLSLLTRLLTDRVKGSALNPLDRSLGFVFGLARGAVLVCLAYIALQWIMPTGREPGWLAHARTLPLVAGGADALRSLVPSETREQTSESAEAARDRARQALESHQMMRDILNPQPKGPPVGSEPPAEGYGDRERKELERLLQSNH
jgi:membrane protein required for colicin V production